MPVVMAVITLLALGLSSRSASATNAPAEKPKAAAPPQTFAKVDFSALPRSSFTIPASPSTGRNPFYPKSVPTTQAPAFAARTNALPMVDTSAFVLNGITGPPMRSAMINGRTFLQGEEAEVRLTSGAKVLIRCSEIGDERAVIEVSGVRRELRLRLGI